MIASLHSVAHARELDDAQYVVTINRDSAPRLMFSGEDILAERLPVGTRVIYAKPPIQALPDVPAAIRYALDHPEGMPSLRDLLTPGCKVTIAVDDISLPLPPMVLPDVRELICTTILQHCTEVGVDDVHLIVANALHRKMTGPEIKRMLGPRIFNQCWPDRLYNFDAEDQAALTKIGVTELGEEAWLPTRVVESDLVIYVNINLVPMDGGHKSIGVGLAPYATMRAHHDPEIIKRCDSYFDPTHSALHDSCHRIGAIVERTLKKVFHIETALNNRMFDTPLDFLARNEDQYSVADRLKARALRATLRALPRTAKRAIFNRVPSPFGVVAVHAGEVNAVHEKILRANFAQYCVPIQGQADIMISGVPFVSPYSVNSILNPLLVQVMGLGYIFNMYRGRPLVRKGGVLILTHHCEDRFHAEHHPSYIEFFHRVLTETRDSRTLQHRHEAEFAHDPRYRKMYQEGHAYHGVHPFYMWYWGENGRQHVGQVIVVGAENPHVPEILGWRRAATLDDAIGMARDFTTPNASITMFHLSPILMAEVS